MKKISVRKYAILSGAVVILTAAVLLVMGMSSRDSDEAVTGETVTAFIGDLSADSTASGVIVPSQQSSLSAKIPGRVEAVFAQVGDWVKVGDALVQLETTDLALNVRLSQQNLRLKEAKLADLISGPTAAQVASAQAALSSAQAQIDDLLSDPSPEELAVLEADLKSAEANSWSSSAQLRQTQNAVKAADIAAAEASLVSAQANLTSIEIQYTRNPSPDDIQANTALAQARQQLNSAQAQLDVMLAGPDANQLGNAQAGLSAAAAQQDAAVARYYNELSGPGTAEIAAAQAQLIQAEANLADLISGPLNEEIGAAEAEVTQARIDLSGAEEALNAATIQAPYDGLITALNFVEGEYASGPVVSMYEGDNLEVILEVDEADIASLIVGQTAVVTLEAFPEESLSASITSIAPGAAQSQGNTLVVYEVHLSLEESALPLRSGMTADANLIVDRRESVLLVPNRAINADRSAGIYTVNLIVGENIEEIPVTIGLRDRQFTEILNGLSSGDELQIDNEIPVDSAFEENNSGPFGG